MDHDSIPSRLSQIATNWTLIRQAHGASADEARMAQAQLFERYQRAIYSYLVKSLRDLDAAQEVIEEFALRLVQGRFRGVDPERGRFRDYLKTTLIRMLVDYRRAAGRGPCQVNLDTDALAALAESTDEAAAFDASWREDLLNRAWEALAAYEQEKGRPYCTVLRYRAEHPDEPSADMAKAISLQLSHEYRADAIRQVLQRARKKYADLLLDEVAATIPGSDLDAVEEEIIALQLLPYCRSALHRRRRASS